MPHIAYLSFAGYGHIAPSLPVVRELRRRGHQVTYSVAKRYAELVEATGASVVAYDSTFPERVAELDTADEVARFAALLLDEDFAPLSDLLDVLATDPPDVVVHDTIMPQSARVLAAHFDVPLVRAHPVFADHDGNPPAAGENDAAKVPDAGHQALGDFETRLDELIEDLGRRHGVGIPAFQRSFENGWEDRHILYMTRSYQLDGDSFDDRYRFVGSPQPAANPDRTWRRPADGRPVALVTASTSTEYPAEFFRVAIDAFAELPWHAVLTTGSGLTPGAFDPLPSNVEVHRWLPHADVLADADLYICQAGVTGMMSALSHGAAVISVATTMAEQLVESQRIEDLKLGKMFRMADYTADNLRAAVTAIESDDAIQAAVRDQRREIEQAGGAVAAADEILACRK